MVSGGGVALKNLKPDLIVEVNPHCLSSLAGRTPTELYEAVSKIYPSIFLIEKNDGTLDRVRRYGDIEAAFGDGQTFQDLYCTFKSDASHASLKESTK